VVLPDDGWNVESRPSLTLDCVEQLAHRLDELGSCLYREVVVTSEQKKGRTSKSSLPIDDLSRDRLLQHLKLRAHQQSLNRDENSVTERFVKTVERGNELSLHLRAVLR
jgi:hypothetical protein